MNFISNVCRNELIRVLTLKHYLISEMFQLNKYSISKHYYFK